LAPGLFDDMLQRGQSVDVINSLLTSVLCAKSLSNVPLMVSLVSASAEASSPGASLSHMFFLCFN
jgi:hypothetical protein